MANHPPYEPYPYPVQFCRLKPGLEIAYMDVGKGDKTILMIHGLGSYSPAWTHTMEGLLGNARCIALDMPNYGRSTLGEFPVSLKWMAEVIRDFVAEMGLESVVLAGHSMGAQVAVWCHYLQLFPIEKLILIAPAGFEQFSSMEQRWFRSISQFSLIRSMSDHQIRRNFEINFYGPQDDAAFMLEDRLLLRENSEAYDLYCQMIPKCMQAMLDEPIWDLLPEINIPVLVLFGTRDALVPNKVLHHDLTPEKVATKGTKRIPGAHLTLVPNAGHFVHWEKASQTNEAIRKFLK